jgi:multisubunit Na+/H+ antiporter MnhF subunit
MITAAFIALAGAGACFFLRLVIGPSLADRVVAIDGLIVVGVSALGVEAVRSGVGSFLPVAVVLTLVGFISTATAARYIERRDS